MEGTKRITVASVSLDNKIRTYCGSIPDYKRFNLVMPSTDQELIPEWTERKQRWLVKTLGLPKDTDIGIAFDNRFMIHPEDPDHPLNKKRAAEAAEIQRLRDHVASLPTIWPSSD